MTMAARESTDREYLDLSKDPVVPGGFTPAMTARAQAMGWTRAPLTTDVYAHVQFRNPKEELYYRDGWVKAGTEVFSKQERAASVFEDFEMVGGCRNIMIRYR
jgi:hypothetical protein